MSTAKHQSHDAVQNTLTLAALLAFSKDLQARMTLHPRFASSCAVAKPMPALPPVMMHACSVADHVLSVILTTAKLVVTFMW